MSEIICPIWYNNELNVECQLKWGYLVCEEWLINWVKTEAKYEFIKAGDPTRSFEDAISIQENNQYSPIIETIKWINIDWQKGKDEDAENEDLGITHRLTYEECLDFIQKSPEQKYRDEYSCVWLDIIVPNNNAILKWPRQGCDYIGYINLRNKCSNYLEWEKWEYKWIEPSLTPFCKKMK